MPDSSREPSDVDELRDLVARCILAFESGGDSEVQELLRGHPDLADEAHVQLRALRDAGLLVPPAPPPEQIGPYRVLRPLGRGAVGTVYLAAREGDVRREVAIKVIRPGMDSREVLARFAVERQALALLDHPNVARALDAGVTDDGRPYLCMDYVSGQPITRYCDTRRLTLRQRVALVAQICDAVHAGHQKGILHRDLKPSNLLVGDRDGQPWPTVIDFGVAKSVGSRLVDVTLVTGRGRLIGTPEYMSPEQAANEVDVDTRTDVHALGVVLHEILCGHLPIASERLRQADERELMRLLQQDTPAPLASHLHDGDAASAEIARNRHTTIAAMKRSLASELNWIVQKAIEKDRNHRYGMVADLAADLRRFLAMEPVAAGPKRPWYRWRKFVSRNRVQVASAALVLLALIGGLSASLAFYARARSNAQRSDASLEIAVDAIDRMVRTGDQDLNVVPHMEVVRRRLLAEALTLQERLSANAGTPRLKLATVRIQTTLARAHGHLGEYTAAIERAERALALLQTLERERGINVQTSALRTTLLFDKANWLDILGRPPAVFVPLLAKACEAARETAAQLNTIQDADKRREYRQLAALAIGRRATSLIDTDSAAAEAYFDEATALLQPLLDASPAAAEQATPVAPDVLTVLAYRARFYRSIGQSKRSLDTANQLQAHLDAAQEIVESPAQFARFLPTMENLGSIYFQLDRTEQSLAIADRMVELRRTLMRDYPGTPAHASGLGTALVNRAMALENAGRIEDVAATLEECLELFEGLSKDRPEVQNYRMQLMDTALKLAQHYVVRSNYGAPFEAAAAIRALDRAIAARSGSGRSSGNPSPSWLRQVAELDLTNGIISARTGELERAEGALRKAAEQYEALQEQRTDILWPKLRLVEIEQRLAQVLLDQNKLAQADEWVATAQRHLQALDDSIYEQNGPARLRRALAGLRARVYARLGRHEACRSSFDQLMNVIPDGDWQSRNSAADIALDALRTTDKDSPWRAPFADLVRETLASAIAIGGEDPASLMVAIMRSKSLKTLAAAEQVVGNLSAAADAQKGVVAGFRKAFEARPTERNRQRVAAAMQSLAALLDRNQDPQAAAAVRAELTALPASGR
ncbi:MAG: protein kinase [Planctomycetota bacterium]